jgi:hypothetical protein
MMMMMMMMIMLAAGIAQWYGAGLGTGWSGVRFPAGAGNFSFHLCVQTGSGALSLGVKRPGRVADNSPPPSAEVKECVGIYLHSHNTSSWRGAQFKKKRRDNLLYNTVCAPWFAHSFRCPF